MCIETLFCIYISKHIQYDGYEYTAMLMQICITIMINQTMKSLIQAIGEDPEDY